MSHMTNIKPQFKYMFTSNNEEKLKKNMTNDKILWMHIDKLFVTRTKLFSFLHSNQMCFWRIHAWIQRK